MPKRCPSCQQMLDEAARFCPICSAPVADVPPDEIFVEGPQGESASSFDESDSPGGVRSVLQTPLPPLPPMSAPRLTKPALMAGVLLGILCAMPVLNCFCLFWMGGGGILAVCFLRNEIAGEISSGTGASLGLLTGLFGACVWQLLEIPLHYVTGAEGMRDAQEIIAKMETLPPESLEELNQLIGLLNDPLNPVFILFSLIIKIILCGVLTTLGGVLGVSLLGQNKSVGP